MQRLQKNGVIPRKTTDLSALRTVTSTGYVLSDALFEWLYDVAFPARIHLSNPSGGTALAGGFAREKCATASICRWLSRAEPNEPNRISLCTQATFSGLHPPNL
jgi:acyl-coenzyme A synthetase/AMP-(fatty) acid ligase